MLPHLQRAHEPSPRRWCPCRQHLQPEEERGLEGDLSLPFGRRCWQRQHAHRTARGWRGSGAHRSNPHMHRVGGQIPEGDARGWGARVPGTGARSLHGRDGRPSAQDACANPRRILLPHAICSQFASTTPVPLVFVRLGKLVAAPSSRLGAEALAFKFTLGLSQSSVSSVLERRSQPPAPT